MSCLLIVVDRCRLLLLCAVDFCCNVLLVVCWLVVVAVVRCRLFVAGVGVVVVWSLFCGVYCLMFAVSCLFVVCWLLVGACCCLLLLCG